MLLSCVPDWPPPFRFAHPAHDRQARTFEPFIAAGFSDAEAFDALFTDDQRLSVFRAVHGNRKGPRRKRRAVQERAATGCPWCDDGCAFCSLRPTADVAVGDAL